MWQWIENNVVEVVGAALALFYLWLEVKERWTMWLVGMAASAFYIWIFFQSKVYAQMALNIYFLFLYVYGLYCWKIVPRKTKKALKTTHIKPAMIGQGALISLVFFVLIAWALKNFTDSIVPYSDAALAALSVAGTWLVARKVLECWFVWIVVNSYSVGLYYYLGLYPTAVLYAVYALMSFVGYAQWKSNMYKEVA